MILERKLRSRRIPLRASLLDNRRKIQLFPDCWRALSRLIEYLDKLAVTLRCTPLEHVCCSQLLRSCLLSGAGVSRRALPQDAYIWQRKWTPALRVALKQSSDLVHAWRVLAAYSDEGGHLQSVAVDWKALKSSGRPVIAVVRINGQLAQ